MNSYTERPTVTLQMAAYDAEPSWLRRAAGSALDQRGCSFELVVVDDGSHVPVATSLAGFDNPRLRIVRIEHAGISAARNVGIETARGLFIRFLDADDYFPPGSTARLLALVASRSEAIACGATRMCREDLTTVWDWTAGCPEYAARSYLLHRCAPM